MFFSERFQDLFNVSLFSSRKGFHPVQSKIADYNATQCGYCTPGFVMSMYRSVNNYT